MTIEKKADDVENSPPESIPMLEIQGQSVMPAALARITLSLTEGSSTAEATRTVEQTPAHPASPAIVTVALPPTRPTESAPVFTSPAKSFQHSHTKCSFVVGRGLVWEDLCPCKPTTESPN